MIHGVTPQKLRIMLEELGPTFVKLGQIMSMRSDMLPQAYCDELKKLRSGVVPMPFETVEEILAAQYGRPAEDVFAWIDRTPLGSASVAQVPRSAASQRPAGGDQGTAPGDPPDHGRGYRHFAPGGAVAENRAPGRGCDRF